MRSQGRSKMHGREREIETGKNVNDHAFTPILLTQTRKITFMKEKKSNAKDFIYIVLTMTSPKYQPTF